MLQFSLILLVNFMTMHCSIRSTFSLEFHNVTKINYILETLSGVISPLQYALVYAKIDL